jgi:hypothetical protein
LELPGKFVGDGGLAGGRGADEVNVRHAGDDSKMGFP